MIAFLLAAAAAAGAVEAERAFAAMAQTHGQWTAFRAYAADDAIMFLPKAGSAQAWLRGRKDPPVSVMWWPGRSWVSCDGGTAINTGPAYYGPGRHGMFTTVWQRQPDGGWKWTLDQGSPTPKAVPATENPKVSRASCRGLGETRRQPPGTEAAHDLWARVEGQMPTSAVPAISLKEGEIVASGSSKDGSLRWEVRAIEDGREGARIFRAWTWDGRRHRLAFVELMGTQAS